MCPFHRSLWALTSLPVALSAATLDLPATDSLWVSGQRTRPSGDPCPSRSGRVRVPGAPSQVGPKLSSGGHLFKERAEQSEAGQFQQIRGSRRPLLSGSGVGPGAGLWEPPPLTPSRVVGSRAPSLGQLRRAGQTAGERPRASGGPTRPGRGVPGRGRSRSAPPAPPAAATAPAAAPPPAPPPWPPRRPPVRRSLQGHRSVCPPALPALLRPSPAIPAAHVASSVPAAASPFPAPRPAAAATRARGLAARVGRATADGVGIKGRPKEQPVATRPAPDPAGGLEQVSGGAPGTASGGHSRARRTPSPAGPAAPPLPPARPGGLLSSWAAQAGLDAQLPPGPGLLPWGLPRAQSPAGRALGSSGLAIPHEG